MSCETSHWAGGSWQQTTELVAVQVTEGELADETCGLFGDLSGAFDCSQSCSRTGNWRSTRGPHISTTGLFRVSRDPKRTGSLAKLTGTDILRACNRSWNDDRCPIRGAYDAACGDANVQVYDRTKRRCYRLHPQPTLAKASLSVLSASPLPGREGLRSPRHRRCCCLDVLAGCDVRRRHGPGWKSAVV